jgi:hypothetical protein
MLHLYGPLPRFSFELGGHANCKVRLRLLTPPSLTLFIITQLYFVLKLQTFDSLPFKLIVVNARQFPFVRQITIHGRVTVTVVESSQRLING